MLSELRSCTCESRGGRPGLPVPNSPYGLFGRKTTLNSNFGDEAVSPAPETCQCGLKTEEFLEVVEARDGLL